jgi:hypothetical protein
MCCVTIGGEQAEYLALTVRGRERPDSADFWDANWLVCTAEVVAGTFRGRLDASLRTDELEGFLRQVERLNERLSGEAELTTMEGWLAVRLTADGRGHVEAICRLCDGPGSGNVLECRLGLDQTFLPPLLRQLASTLSAYPVLCRNG